MIKMMKPWVHYAANQSYNQSYKLLIPNWYNRFHLYERYTYVDIAESISLGTAHVFGYTCSYVANANSLLLLGRSDSVTSAKSLIDDSLIKDGWKLIDNDAEVAKYKLMI